MSWDSDEKDLIKSLEVRLKERVSKKQKKWIIESHISDAMWAGYQACQKDIREALGIEKIEEQVTNGEGEDWI